MCDVSVQGAWQRALLKRTHCRRTHRGWGWSSSRGRRSPGDPGGEYRGRSGRCWGGAQAQRRPNRRACPPHRGEPGAARATRPPGPPPGWPEEPRATRGAWAYPIIPVWSGAPMRGDRPCLRRPAFDVAQTAQLFKHSLVELLRGDRDASWPTGRGSEPGRGRGRRRRKAGRPTAPGPLGRSSPEPGLVRGSGVPGRRTPAAGGVARRSGSPPRGSRWGCDNCMNSSDGCPG